MKKETPTAAHASVRATISNKHIGYKGEETAANYLIRHGYRIIARNWQFHHLEIDIVAENRDYVIFVEVKQRSSASFGTPELFVDWQKQRHIITAANHFVHRYNLEKEVRFDIISILASPDGTDIKHIPGAFLPTW